MDVLNFREPASAWTHLCWLVFSVPASFLLFRRCRGQLVKQLCFVVYGLSLTAGYGGSVFYHAIRLPHNVVEGPCQNVDFIGIYVMIAGNVTPLAVIALGGAWRRAVLSLAWGLATVGIAVRACDLHVSRGLSNCVYLGMGWGLVLCYFELSRKLSHQRMGLLVLGGLIYSSGAVMNWLCWPRLWPGVFCHHDLYHLFIMAGTAVHFVFMWRTLAPYRPVPVVQPVARPAMALLKT